MGASDGRLKDQAPGLTWRTEDGFFVVHGESPNLEGSRGQGVRSSRVQGFEGYASRAPLFSIFAVCDGYYTEVSWGQGVEWLFFADSCIVLAFHLNP